jgi:DNA-binding transcriptional regulator GbsR (MarR family)
MIEKELDIARRLGASSFLLYAAFKDHSKFTVIDAEITTGLSRDCISQNMKKLLECKILSRTKQNWGSPRAYEYTVNKEFNII